MQEVLWQLPGQALQAVDWPRLGDLQGQRALQAMQGPWGWWAWPTWGQLLPAALPTVAILSMRSNETDTPDLTKQCHDIAGVYSISKVQMAWQIGPRGNHSHLHYCGLAWSIYGIAHHGKAAAPTAQPCGSEAENWPSKMMITMMHACLQH